MKPQPDPTEVSQTAKASSDFRDSRTLIDSEEAAAIIASSKTLQRYARRGLIRGVHVGKLWRFRGSTMRNGSTGRTRELIRIFPHMKPLVAPVHLDYAECRPTVLATERRRI